MMSGRGSELDNLKGIVKLDNNDIEKAVAEFFGISRFGPEMEAILEEPATHALLRQHLENLYLLIEATKDLLFGAEAPDPNHMPVEWLTEAYIITSKGEKTPLEVLADPRLTKEVLEEIGMYLAGSA